jgi:hypothetical protein
MGRGNDDCMDAHGSRDDGMTGGSARALAQWVSGTPSARDQRRGSIVQPLGKV